MSRNVNVILLCEDTQHEAFVRRFLGGMGWDTRRLRVEKGIPGVGSGEQFVHNRFPLELQAYRSKANHVNQCLLVILDGDNVGVDGRLKSLDASCASKNVECRDGDDLVAIFVPTWNIETWLTYLDGEDVVEEKRDYPKLKRARDCQRHVGMLIEMCRAGELRAPAPQSLHAACVEYKARLVN